MARKMDKRSEAITVKMTPADLENFKEAARILWPGAVLSKSSMILGLARMCADETIKDQHRRRGKPPGSH